MCARPGEPWPPHKQHSHPCGRTWALRSSNWLFSFDAEHILYSDLLEGFRPGVNFFTGSGVSDILDLDETDEIQSDVAHRAARLYRFNEKHYRTLLKEGINFEL